MLEINAYSYKQDKFLLNWENLKVPPHGMTFIKGASGSGKTTFLELIIGLIESPDFSWSLNGAHLSKLPIAHRNIGYVMQGGFIYPHLTPKQMFELVLESKGKKSKNKVYLQEWLSICELEERHINTLGKKLSGGESQRVAIVMALLQSPNLLVLDEPFSAIDSALKEKVVQLIVTFVKKYKVTALLSSHNFPAQVSASTVLNISEGQVRFESTK